MGMAEQHTQLEILAKYHGLQASVVAVAQRVATVSQYH